MIKHIFLDMDGVLCDFHKAALALHGKTIEDIPLGEWDLSVWMGISYDQLWEPINKDPDFWTNLEPFDHVAELVVWLDRLKKRGVEWRVLTAPARDPQCFAQKVMWLRKYLGHRAGKVIMTGDKWLLAQPCRLLIDDADHNVKPFREHGGTAVLWPARWNSNHLYLNCLSPLGYVQSAVEYALSERNQ